jgi:hypothetical protein
MASACESPQTTDLTPYHHQTAVHNNMVAIVITDNNAIAASSFQWHGGHCEPWSFTYHAATKDLHWWSPRCDAAEADANIQERIQDDETGVLPCTR